MSTLVQLEPCGNEERLSAERSLTQAFASFTEAAGSLERSYHQLERELARLRRELEERNRELARSLEENRTIRNSLHRILEGLPCGVLVVEGRSGDLSAANPAALLVAGQLQGLRRPVAHRSVPEGSRRYSRPGRRTYAGNQRLFAANSARIRVPRRCGRKAPGVAYLN